MYVYNKSNVNVYMVLIFQWCIRGECVDDGSPLIDGDWGSWSNYSDCTKECAIGVAYQLRECNNPRFVCRY